MSAQKKGAYCTVSFAVAFLRMPPQMCVGTGTDRCVQELFRTVRHGEHFPAKLCGNSRIILSFVFLQTAWVSLICQSGTLVRSFAK